MAVKGELYPTLVDVAKRTDKNGQIATIVEMLNETNEVLDDMVFYECNDGTKHKSSIRTGLPASTWRAFYEGVQPSKSSTAQVEDATGMLESRASVDKDLVEINTNPKAFRLSEDRAHLEGMNQEMAETIFYGNSKTEKKKFMGLAPRFSSLSDDKTKIGYNVINGGGDSSDNTSIWFITWGPNTVHGIYPKGKKAGFDFQDLGEMDANDANGNPFRSYQSLYKWHAGVTVRDWRGVVRIANIDVTGFADAGESDYAGPNLPNLMIKAWNRWKMRKMGRAAIYCNETVKTALDLLASNKSNTFFTIKEGLDGNPITTFRGVPIRTVDALINLEGCVA